MTELVPYQPRAELAVPAASDIDSWTQIVGQVVKLANEIYDTPFIPDGLRGSAAAVSACILAGREMGLGPMTSLANIDVIRGKPTQKPLLMRAMILSHGHKWEDVENTDYRAVVRGRRKDESDWTTVTFTADQAKKAGLNLGNWPADKLYARASSRLAKHRFADVIMGIPYTPEDVEDGLDVEVTVTSDSEAPAIEAAKPRTAQRKARTQAPSPAAPERPRSGPAVPPSEVAAAGEGLPPLPGEEDPTGAGPAPAPASTAAPASGQTAPPDDTDYDTHGTATRGKGGQLTALWTVLSTEFGFKNTDADKAQARTVCEYVINRELEGDTTGDLSYNEARTVLDTLAHWQHQAGKEGKHPREYMIALMVAQDGEVPGA
jgi:hypothetical protein